MSMIPLSAHTYSNTIKQPKDKTADLVLQLICFRERSMCKFFLLAHFQGAIPALTENHVLNLLLVKSLASKSRVTLLYSSVSRGLVFHVFLG